MRGPKASMSFGTPTWTSTRHTPGFASVRTYRRGRDLMFRQFFTEPGSASCIHPWPVRCKVTLRSGAQRFRSCIDPFFCIESLNPSCGACSLPCCVKDSAMLQLHNTRKHNAAMQQAHGSPVSFVGAAPKTWADRPPSWSGTRELLYQAAQARRKWPCP